MSQTIIVDISTRGANPVAYTHQGDTGRTFFAEIYENGEEFAVAGYTIKVGAILPADRGYTVIAGNDMVTATKTNDNTTNKIYFTLSDKYSLKAGNGILTLIFTSNTGTPSTIRPINIDLRIQKSADADDTIAGASDFPEGLEAIAEEVFQEYLSTYLPPVAPSASAAANKAADAKLTGQELDNLKSDLNSSKNYILSGEYQLRPFFKSGTAKYYQVGDFVGEFVAQADRQTTRVIDAPIGTTIKVTASGDYAIRILNANSNNIITEASDYVTSYTFNCGGKYVIIARNKTNPSTDITNVSIADYVSVTYENFYLDEKLKKINANEDAVFSGNYFISQTWFHGTTFNYSVGDQLEIYTTNEGTGQTRQRTNATREKIGQKLSVSVSGDYLIRVLNANTSGIITSVSEYQKVVDIICDGMYAIIFKKSDESDISSVSPSDYVTVNKITAIKELQNAVAYNTQEQLVPLTQGVPQTASDYIALWEKFVDDGYCTKSQIATVDGLPVYKYVFSIDGDTLSGDLLDIVSDGSYYSKPKISMISGQHGDEKGSPLYLYEFFNKVCYNQAYQKYLGAFDFYVIPLVNPTGYNLNTRNNYNNQNINRDGTSSPQTIEGQALKTHFDSHDWKCCFDFHQMSAGHGTTNFTHSCGYMSMQFGASIDITNKYNKMLCTVGYETEKLMEAYTKRPHEQMFQPWIWTEDYHTWTSYPVNVVHKTDISFVFETAQTWYYYSGSGTDLNGIALIGGNTFTDKFVRMVLDDLI